MLGPSLSEQGGMGAVQKQIIQGTSEKVTIRHASIWNGKTSTLVLFVKALLLLVDNLIKKQVDLVHLHMSERGSVLRNSILALLAFAFSKPVIMHTHGCEFHLFYDNLPQIVQHAINKVLQNCAYVIALSKSWQNTYVNKCELKADRVVVLYNPVVIPEYVHEHSDSGKITFLFLGKVNQRKGVFDLLQALVHFSPAHRKKMRLIVAGNGEITKALNLVKQLDIESLVTFPGWVDTRKRDQLLAEADVFVLPSYNEGLPMALLEAMSYNLPVITTPVGGIPEVVTHNKTGLLIEPGNIPALAASMQTLIDEKSLKLKLGNAARKQASLLDIKNYSHDILNMYHSALKN